jgi:hypothetical protein
MPLRIKSWRQWEGKAEMRPLWADFFIGGLIFWAVLLPLEYAGGSAVILAAVVAAGALALLLTHRWRRRT